MYKKSKFAFSLIELLIVISALLIFFTITIPKMSFLNRFLLKNEINRLSCTFSYLQQKAIASNSEQKLFFDLNKNIYFYVDENTKKHIINMPKQLKFGYLKNIYGPPANPQKVIDKAITFKSKKELFVRFLNNGNIQSGTVYIIDKNHKFMGALTTAVAQKTFIRNYFYTNDKWIMV